jgi:diketogulonate reductase-like aldo/keto reductase
MMADRNTPLKGNIGVSTVAKSNFVMRQIHQNILKMKTTNSTLHMPVLGFGTLIPNAAETSSAVRYGLEAGFRHFDCAERYRNESEVGEALQAGLAAGGIAR